MKKQAVLIVGAGLSGSVIARTLAEAGFNVDIIEQRAQVSGNCYSSRDPDSNIMIHHYGPHIFHTNNEEVWSFINQYAEIEPYFNRVKALTQGKIFSLPINLQTLNQFFNKTLLPNDARDFIDDLGDNSIRFPESFEQQIQRFIGKDMYEAFFKGYAIKQWGIPPSLLPASIVRRLPIRFDYNDAYYNHRYQGMPKQGFHRLVENILDHKNIRVHLQQAFNKQDSHGYQHIFYSGGLDSYFNYEDGRFNYRTIDVESFSSAGDYQGTEIMHYCDENVPYTRIIEYKYFTPWEKYSTTVYHKEYIRDCNDNDEPYYPVRILCMPTLKKYVSLAKQEQRITFIGRLGTYRYLDMDVAISEALHCARVFIGAVETNAPMPAFTVQVI